MAEPVVMIITAIALLAIGYAGWHFGDQSIFRHEEESQDG